MPQVSYLSREAVREVDRRAIQELGIPGVVLMENAGRAAAELVLRVRPRADDRPVVILCGRGNNGGDGLVVARHLQIHGVPVHVLLLAPGDSVRGDAAVNLHIVRRARIRLDELAPGDDLARFLAPVNEASLLVDALLGTGASGNPRSPYAEAIQAANDSGAPVVAIDVPSGLDCDTGQPGRPCIRAAHTCTFVAPKRGFARDEARQYLGRLHVASIGVPPWLVKEVASR